MNGCARVLVLLHVIMTCVFSVFEKNNKPIFWPPATHSSLSFSRTHIHANAHALSHTHPPTHAQMCVHTHIRSDGGYDGRRHHWSRQGVFACLCLCVRAYFSVLSMYIYIHDKSCMCHTHIFVVYVYVRICHTHFMYTHIHMVKICTDTDRYVKAYFYFNVFICPGCLQYIYIYTRPAVYVCMCHVHILCTNVCTWSKYVQIQIDM